MGSINVDGSSIFSRQLLPCAVDRIAETEPDATWATISISPTKIDAGFQDITYLQFANAINGIAWWLEEELGRGDTSEPLAFFGTSGSDVRYAILLIAAVKAQYYTLFNSPRNSIDAHISVFEAQKCRTIIVPDPPPPYVAPLLVAYPMRVLQFPNLQGLFSSRPLSYLYRKTFEEACNNPLVSLHTSGTTGLPKARTITLGCAATMASLYNSPAIDGVKCATTLVLGEFLLGTMPMFHAAGLFVNIISVVYCRQKIAFPPPEGPPLCAEAAVSAIKSTGVTAASLPPSTLNDIGKSPQFLDTLSALKYVIVGGGSISKAAGDAIMKRTTLVNLFGTTELGVLQSLEVDQKDWAYIRPSVNAGVEFRHLHRDEYEMVVVRDERLQGMQPTFEIFPDLQEFSTHDLFLKHPTKQDCWLYHGRSDDVIVFLNGEKTNPILMEEHVQNHPDVRSALVIGQNRFEAALMIEPSQPTKLSTNGKAELVERVWPVVEEANRQSPAYARVSKSHILFTSPEKPMSRTSKNTVQRKSTVENYAVEIDRLYSDAATLNDRNVPIKIDPLNIQQSLHQVIAFTMGLTDLKIDEDLFSRGMDSLQVIQTARYIKSALREAGMKAGNVGPSTIYTNPTIARLATAVECFEQTAQQSRDVAEPIRIDNMRKMLEKYRSQALDTVVLTGSTGALGSYLLEAFVKCETVSKIYCLNRSTDSEQRQKVSSASRGLTSQWSPERVVFLTSNFSRDDLGLSPEMLSQIRDLATVIVHNAWQVDFNLSLASYEQGHIKGVQNLIHLSATSANRAKIFFISSIAAVMAWQKRHAGCVPEEIIDDFTVPQPMGYAESKHISERLLALASAEFDIPVSICRVGQVAGPVHGSQGMWNKQEWIPSLILSSTHLGVLPESLGILEDIDWIPIDLLSNIISSLALRPSSPNKPISVYHTVNPSLTVWAALLPHVQAELGPGISLVPFAAWVKTLRASSAASADAQDFNANPALKLLDFYESLLGSESAPPPRLATMKTERECALLTEVGPVTGDWMRKWIRQWGVKR